MRFTEIKQTNRKNIPILQKIAVLQSAREDSDNPMRRKIDQAIKVLQNQVEETTASAIATSMGNGNGFVNGGPGTIRRNTTKTKRQKSKRNTA